MQAPPPYVPLIEYVLKALEHPPYMFVSKLAACCTMLFLTRENPELLQELVEKWAIRFAMDRPKLVEHIRKRSGYNFDPVPAPTNSPNENQSSLDVEERPTNEEKHTDVAQAPPPASLGQTATFKPKKKLKNGKTPIRCCNHVEFTQHFLTILNSLVPMYFSWNWHRADYVIEINREYEIYIRDQILPLCERYSAVDGMDDEDHHPWLLPPHTYLSRKQTVLSFYSPTSTVSRFPPSSLSCSGSEQLTPIGPPRYSGGGVTAAAYTVGGGHSCPNAFGGGATFQEVMIPHFTSPCTSKESAVGLIAASAQRFSPTIEDLHAGVVTSSGRYLAPDYLSEAGSRMPFQSLVSPTSSGAPPLTGADVSDLRLLSLGNFREALDQNQRGLVIIFYAKYSTKSNEVLEAMRTIMKKKLLSPMPAMAIVYAVAEPELSSIFRVGWFPTIVYIPPRGSEHSPVNEGGGIYAEVEKASSGIRGSDMDGDSEHMNSSLTSLGSSSASSSPLLSARSVGGATPPPPPELSAEERANHEEREEEDEGFSTFSLHPPSTLAVPSQGARRSSQCIPITPTSHAHGGTHNGGASTQSGLKTPTELLFGLSAGDSAGSSSGKLSTPKGPLVSLGADDKTPWTASSHLGLGAELSSTSLSNVESPLSTVEAGTASAVAELENSFSVRQIVDQEGQLVYPMNGPLTVPALVQWISSKGTSVPDMRKTREDVTCIKAIKEELKFKKKRERHSAVVILRKLQQASKASPPSMRSLTDPPVFIMLGGGMAAGKTTAVTALSTTTWWHRHKDQSVVINADEFKLPDETARSIAENHAHSTRAAENLMIQAVNQGRSVVFDGTMMWLPFVQQVVSMVRTAHLTLYEQGPGYNSATKEEIYFVPTGPRREPLPLPYRMICLGITVDVETAVPRGFIRKFSTGRGVPISSQLNSFKLFAENFPTYVSLMDETTLYNNNVFVDLSKGELPPIMAEKTAQTGGEFVIHDPAAYEQFMRQRGINEEADNIGEVYPVSPNRSSVL